MRKFIIGTDWWTDCDDAVAMRLLAGAHRDGTIDIMGIGINACMEYSAASLDGFLNAEGVRDIPIGIDLDAVDFGGRPPYQKRLAPYAAEYLSNEDAENAVSLYRRLLAESEQKAEIIEIGYLQVIAAVLESGADDISPKTGIELIREKVSKIWVMAGKWDEEGGRENNFARNARSCKAAASFCARCPVPITFLGYEAGVDVISGNMLHEDDILYQILCDHGSSEGRSSWDPMLVLLALAGDEKHAGYRFAQGTASVDPRSGRNYFTHSPNGSHRYVIKENDNTYYQKAINDRLSPYGQ